MKVRLAVIFSLSFLVPNCGTEEKRIYKRSAENIEFTQIKNQVLELEGTLAMITSFVAGDYSTCNESTLPPFELKICRIAQTANAEQLVQFSGQLNRVVGFMQESLYGPDCTNTIDQGCPVANSIVEKIDNLDLSVIAQLQTDVNSLQTSINGLTSRLDDFDGSGESLETVINNIELDIAALESRIDDIENTIAGSDYYTWVFLCNDAVTINEPVLLRGDKQELIGYVDGGSGNGMGMMAKAGVSGHQYLTTSIKPKCSFKVYDLNTSLKICWNNSDRSASALSIDTECDLGGSFASPTVNCTCKE